MQTTSDNATPKLKLIFFHVMRDIAADINNATQFISDLEVHRSIGHRAPPPKVLDLCMAPGGFTEQVRQSVSPLAVFNGITLPLSLGGHDLLLENSTRLKVEFLDITMLAGEMGFEMADIAMGHPDYDLFRFDRPFFNQKYDLILCDGKVLRTHKRQEYREKTEGFRLRFSQLVFALHRIKAGGSFVMLFHKVDSPHTLNLIYKFHKFSASVKLFKPSKYHAMRSSFYLVAKGVNPHSVDALQAIDEWKQVWASCTLRGEEPVIAADKVQIILDEFGEKYIEMCDPMWKIQLGALSRNLKNGFKCKNLKI